MRTLAIFLTLFWSSFAQAATILPPAPFTFANNTTADATQINANFSSIISNTNTYAAENGVNASITSLTGLTTPLPASEGGTGLTSFTLSLAAPVSIAQGGTGQTTATTGFNALSPLTTQGDVLYFDGTNNARLGAGANGQFLETTGAGSNPVWATIPNSANQYFINVKLAPYNAACDSSTDDTTAIQNAVYAAVAAGGGVYLPGVCRITSQIVINGGIEFKGGGYNTGLLLSGNIYGLYVISTVPVIIDNMTINAGGGGTSAAIFLNASSTNYGSVIHNVQFTNFYDGIYGYSGFVDIKIYANNFNAFTHHAIEWHNALNAQQGDVSVISNNFRNASTVGTAIYLISGGGFRIVSNKVNLCANAVFVSINTTGLPVGGATYDFLVSNNSFEGMGTTGIYFTETDNTLLYNVQVVDNELTMGVANVPSIQFANPNNTTWISGFQVIGNVMQTTAANGGAVINLAGANVGVVTGNVETSYAATPAIGLEMASSATLGTSNTHTLQATTGYTANGAGAGWVNTN